MKITVELVDDCVKTANLQCTAAEWNLINTALTQFGANENNRPRDRDDAWAMVATNPEFYSKWEIEYINVPTIGKT